MIPKQTAVEWLFEKVWVTPISELPKILKEAKEMEKQQIIEAHGDKERFKCNPDSIVTYGYTFTGEMYYNKTFKNTNK
jgi:hypothetical protein